MQQDHDIDRLQDDSTLRLVDTMIMTGVALVAVVIVVANIWA